MGTRRRGGGMLDAASLLLLLLLLACVWPQHQILVAADTDASDGEWEPGNLPLLLASYNSD
jgi:hypothetical protein